MRIVPISHHTYIHQKKKSNLVKYMSHPTLRSTVMVRLPLSPFPDILFSLWLGDQGFMDCFPWAPLLVGF